MRAIGVAILGVVLSMVILGGPVAGAWSTGGSDHNAPPVFVMTNAAIGNEIVVYERGSSGSLSWVENVSTGGNGTGASLADSGSLAVTSDHRWLLAVDAGSDQISVFAIGQHHGTPTLELTDVVGSGGVLPVSIATFGWTVYVLNDGSATAPGNIAGFYLTWSGQLRSIGGSDEPLSAPTATGAAQIAFSPYGNFLVVTEKATNTLDVYSLGWSGRAGPAVTHPSQGGTPYGFAFTPQGAAIVSEASTGSLSSYRPGYNGQWSVLSSAIPDFQGAPCWVAVANGGSIAFTTNAHSDSISSYSVSFGGRIALQTEVAASTDAAPTDMSVTTEGQLLYVYDAGAGEIQGFQIGETGSLSSVSVVGGLPASAEGLIAL